jgi:hypothetical protein
MAGFTFDVRVELDGWTIEKLEALEEAVAEAIRVKTNGKRRLKMKTDWTASALTKVLSHLRGTKQFRAIEAAARGGGTVTRAEVMDILGRDEAKRLTGFTKPIGRAVQELIDEGEEIPAEPFPFSPVYDGGSKAQGFRIKPAALTRVRAALADLQ